MQREIPLSTRTRRARQSVSPKGSIVIVDNQTPVLVMGATEHGSLGIIRSLGRLGVPVYALESVPFGPAAFSRFCKQVFAWNLVDEPEAATVKKLIDVGSAIGRPAILIPTWDEMACLLDRSYDRLSEYFIFPKQPAGLLELLSSKIGLHDLAQEHGVPTARISAPNSDGELDLFLENSQFPLVLKRVIGNQRRAGAAGAVIVRSRDELRDKYRDMREPGFPNVMLQEYIPSPDTAAWMFNGYFNENSDCLVGFTGHKIRHTPIHSGMTCLGVCRRNDEVDSISRRFLKALGYRGVVDIDYCYDARDGQYKILDVNPRVGASFRMFVDGNGLDVVRAMYLDTTGQRVPELTAFEGRRWMVERDFLSAWQQLREGSLSLREWLGSLWGIDEFGYFSVDDLRPFLQVFPHLLRRRRRSNAGSRPSRTSVIQTTSS